MTDRSLFEAPRPAQASLSLDQAGELAQLRARAAALAAAAVSDLEEAAKLTARARGPAAGGPADAELFAALSLLRHAVASARLASDRVRSPNS